MVKAREGHEPDRERQRLLRVLAAATFIIFFQGFMVAPLIPHLAEYFQAPFQVVGYVVPAYLIPYGLAVLIYGPLSDRWGLKSLILASLFAFIALTVATATARTVWQLIGWRAAAAIGTAAVVPLSLIWVGSQYSYQRRGQPLGVIFAALAGGIATGKTLGVLVVPLIGWRGLFIAIAAVSLPLFLLLWPQRKLLGKAKEEPGPGFRGLAKVSGKLLGQARGLSTYSYVLLNSIFHGGVYTWLGVYFRERYGLGDIGIALAILGYGIPGFLFSRPIGRMADRWGRRWLLPPGLAIGAVSALALMPEWGVVLAAIVVFVLSLGFALTQPLFAGIVTDLGGPQHMGQAMGLNVFMLFNGFGLGALLFGQALAIGFNTALIWFALGEMFLAVAAIWLFRGETPGRARE